MENTIKNLIEDVKKSRLERKDAYAEYLEAELFLGSGQPKDYFTFALELEELEDRAIESIFKIRQIA